MSSAREIKRQVASIRKIQKITDAMQKVAASKMRKMQKKMQNATYYSKKIKVVMDNIASSQAITNYAALYERKQVNKVGYIIISTDRGLCGGLNINLFKLAMEHSSEFQKQGISSDWCLLGGKMESSFHLATANIVTHNSHLGESPRISDLVDNIKIMVDAYKNNFIDHIFVAHNKFVNAMMQEPVITQLLPLQRQKSTQYQWDYIYEPTPIVLLDTLLVKYVETQVYQAVLDNIACEQVARMMAMKNATDSANELIEGLQLMYNKARQATITQEIAEIIGGASICSLEK